MHVRANNTGIGNIELNPTRYKQIMGHRLMYKSLSKNKIMKDFLSLLSGRLSGAVFNFLILMLLMNRLTLPEFGQFTYLFALMGALQLTLDVGMDNSFVANSSKKYLENRLQYEIEEATFLNLKYVLCAVIIAISALTFIIKNDILLLVIMLSSVPLGLADTLLTTLRIKGSFKTVGVLVAAINILRFLIVGGLSIANVVDINYVMFGYAISNIIYLCLCYISAQVNVWKPIFSFRVLQDIFSLTKWLFLYNISILLMMRMEVFFLEYYSAKGFISNNELGVYGAAFRLAFFLPLITSSLTAALLPKISQIDNQAEIDIFLKKIPKMIIPVVIIFGAAYLAAYPVIHFAFSGKYDSSIVIFQLVLFGVACTIFTNTLMLLFYATKQLNLLVILSGVQLLTNIILDIFLIKNYGAVGAGLSMLLVRVIGLLLVGYFTITKLRYGSREANYATKISSSTI